MFFVQHVPENLQEEGKNKMAEFHQNLLISVLYETRMTTAKTDDHTSQSTKLLSG
jgi:hypothetical protein